MDDHRSFQRWMNSALSVNKYLQQSQVIVNIADVQDSARAPD